MTLERIDAEAVLSAARRYGIDLQTAEVDALAQEANQVNETLATAETPTFSGRQAEAVREGTDDHNAFRYRFDLSGGDGPLSSFTVALKDNVAVANVPMTCGSDAFDFTPQFSATVVRRLLATGAKINGTTNMDEFAYFSSGETCAHGPVENPRVDGHIAGGSSAGSAAAVASGDVDCALGTDTAGSIRIPASFCGVVGFKPTYGIVSRFGIADLAPSHDHVGPLAPDVETTARVYEAISGRDHHDLTTRLAPTQVTVSPENCSPDELIVGVVEEGVAGATNDVMSCFKETIETLTPRVRDVQSVSIPEFEHASIALLGINGAEFATWMANDGVTLGPGTGCTEESHRAVADLRERGNYGDIVRNQLVVNGALLEATGTEGYIAAQEIKAAITERVTNLFASVDALVLPTTPIPAPKRGELQTFADIGPTVANTGPFNLTGHPALSVPCGNSKGLPIGFQIVADYLDDDTIFALGAEIERIAERRC
jgi:Asp-tRNA(Asn)/Glu-tRNA(Gln) amidotransferase A subunit family amidase